MEKRSVGRPKKFKNSSRLSILIEQELKDKIQQIAQHNNKTISQVVSELLNNAIR